MPTLVQRSAGTNTEASATTIANATNSTIPSGDKVFAFVSWFGNVTCTGVAGGSLTWTVRSASTGAAVIHTAIATADAPSGLASGTTITATFSATCAARGIISGSADGLVLEATGPDATTSTAAASGTNWTQNITTVASTTLVIGYVGVDAHSGGIAPTGAGVTEAIDWTLVDSTWENEAVYLNSVSSGSKTVGGTFTGTRTRCISALSYALSGAVAYPFELLTQTPRFY